MCLFNTQLNPFHNLRSKIRSFLCLVWIMKNKNNLFLNYCVIPHLSRKVEIIQRFSYLIIYIFLNILNNYWNFRNYKTNSEVVKNIDNLTAKSNYFQNI